MGQLKTSVLLIALLLLGLAGAVQAKFDSGLVNISLGNKDSVYEGKGVLGADKDKWNAMDGANGDKVAVTDAKGGKTEVTFTWASDGTYDADDAGFNGTPYEKLLRHYLFAHSNKVTISGLTPKAEYDVVVFSASNSNGRTTKFTIGKDSKSTTYDSDKKELQDGVNYARFTATADADGNIVITYEADDGEGNLNAVQITPKTK